MCLAPWRLGGCLDLPAGFLERLKKTWLMMNDVRVVVLINDRKRLIC